MPALLLPATTLADTHLKNPENDAASMVSNTTTLSVSCNKCSVLALGPAAQATILASLIAESQELLADMHTHLRVSHLS